MTLRRDSSPGDEVNDQRMGAEEKPNYVEVYRAEKRRRKRAERTLSVLKREVRKRNKAKSKAMEANLRALLLSVEPRTWPGTPSEMERDDLEDIVFRGNLALCPNLITMANLPNHYQETLEHLASFYHGAAGELDTILTRTSEDLLADMERVHLDQEDVLYPTEAPLTGLLSVHLARMFSQLKPKTEARILPLARSSIRFDRSTSNGAKKFCEPDVLIRSEVGDELFHYPVVVEMGKSDSEEDNIVTATAKGVTLMQNAFFQRQKKVLADHRKAKLEDIMGGLLPVLAVIMKLNPRETDFTGTVSLVALYPRVREDWSSDNQFCAQSVDLWDTAGLYVPFDKDLFKRILLSIALFSAPGFVQPGIFQIERRVYLHAIDGQEYCYKYFSSCPKEEYQYSYSMYLQEFSRLGAELVFPKSSADEAMQNTSWCASKGTVIRYPSVQGFHSATHAAQFVPILQQLQSMHNEGYVHGDIRLANMIFDPTHPDRSRLIDFDFAGKASTRRYPKWYTTALEDAERHQGAREFRRLEKEHDMYSMRRIMDLFTGTKSKYAKRWAKYADDPMSLVAAKPKRYRSLSLVQKSGAPVVETLFPKTSPRGQLGKRPREADSLSKKAPKKKKAKREQNA